MADQGNDIQQDSAQEQNAGSSSTSSQDNTNFNFDQWSQSYGLLKNTIKKLQKEDLITREALILLRTEDIPDLNLTVGQRRLFEKAVNSLSENEVVTKTLLPSVTTATKDTHTTNSTAQDVTEGSSRMTIQDIRNQSNLNEAGKHFDELFLPASATSQITNSLQRQNLKDSHDQVGPTIIDSNDPRTTLTMKSCSRKALHIHNFISEASKKRLKYKRNDLILAKEQGEDGITSETLVFKAAVDDTNPYHGISVSEWSAANCRLLNQLLINGDLLRQDLEFYLAYTAMIMDFVSNYEWRCILDFDFHYREQQAAHSFQWGYINPMMKLQYLTPRQQSGHHTNGHMYNNRNSLRRRSQLHEECRQWKANNGYCSFGSTCRYRHIPLNTITSTASTQQSLPKNGNPPVNHIAR